MSSGCPKTVTCGVGGKVCAPKCYIECSPGMQGLAPIPGNTFKPGELDAFVKGGKTEGGVCYNSKLGSFWTFSGYKNTFNFQTVEKVDTPPAADAVATPPSAPAPAPVAPAPVETKPPPAEEMVPKDIPLVPLAPIAPKSPPVVETPPTGSPPAEATPLPAPAEAHEPAPPAETEGPRVPAPPSGAVAEAGTEGVAAKPPAEPPDEPHVFERYIDRFWNAPLADKGVFGAAAIASILAVYFGVRAIARRVRGGGGTPPQTERKSADSEPAAAQKAPVAPPSRPATIFDKLSTEQAMEVRRLGTLLAYQEMIEERPWYRELPADKRVDVLTRIGEYSGDLGVDNVALKKTWPMPLTQSAKPEKIAILDSEGRIEFDPGIELPEYTLEGFAREYMALVDLIHDMESTLRPFMGKHSDISLATRFFMQRHVQRAAEWRGAIEANRPGDGVERIYPRGYILSMMQELDTHVPDPFGDGRPTILDLPQPQVISPGPQAAGAPAAKPAPSAKAAPPPTPPSAAKPAPTPPPSRPPVKAPVAPPPAPAKPPVKAPVHKAQAQTPAITPPPAKSGPPPTPQAAAIEPIDPFEMIKNGDAEQLSAGVAPLRATGEHEIPGPAFSEGDVVEEELSRADIEPLTAEDLEREAREAEASKPTPPAPDQKPTRPPVKPPPTPPAVQRSPVAPPPLPSGSQGIDGEEADSMSDRITIPAPRAEERSEAVIFFEDRLMKSPYWEDFDAPMRTLLTQSAEEVGRSFLEAANDPMFRCERRFFHEGLFTKEGIFEVFARMGLHIGTGSNNTVAATVRRPESAKTKGARKAEGAKKAGDVADLTKKGGK